MPFITLTSDIGEQDYLVAAIKAQLMKALPDAQVIDISHRISPFNYPQAAYISRSALNHFPEYSFHLILVNLFEAKPEHLLLAYHQGQYLFCGDNGILPMILGGAPELVIAVPVPDTISPTLLGCTALVAQTISKVVAGSPLAELGEESVAYREKRPLQAFTTDNMIEGQILFIDRFENVIVNITREEFEQHRKNRRFSIVFKRDEVIEQISDSYADVPEGEKLALFNSAGYLEIAINKGNAAGLFGLKGFSERNQQLSTMLQNRLFYQTVKIYFE